MAIASVNSSPTYMQRITASPEQTSGMRMMVPVLNTVQQMRTTNAAVQGFRNSASNVVALEGGVTAGGSAVNAIGSTLSSGLKSLPSLLKSNVVVAAIGSAITGVIDLFRGEKPTKVAANFLADTAAYTGIGATATMIGGMVGSLVPGIGTIIGIGVGALVGLGLGKLYEGNVRSKFSNFFSQNVVAKLVPEQPNAQPAA